MDRRDFMRTTGAIMATGAMAGTALGQLPDRQIRVGFAAHSIDLQALFGQLREGFRGTLDEAGLDYEYVEAAPNASSDHAGMLSILENMAAQQLDYVLVGPTSLELNEPGLRLISESGAKLLMTDYVRPEEGVSYDDAVLNWVVYSHSEMGFKAGEWLGDQMRAQGIRNPRVVMLWGPAASEISQQRGEGAIEGMNSHSDLEFEIVYEANADFDRRLAYDETERALAAYDFDAIMCLNSYMSVSASNAIGANGRTGEIVVCGMGGTIDELQGIATGDIGVAPFRDPRSMGRASAEALLAHLTGREGDIERTVYADIPVLENAYRIRQSVPSEMFDVAAFLNEHHG
ncbi:sugar ABC transporter substrate-binding protein [Pelagibacterium montanilacus]|uniref:sugar ABC transporter substrate-binding protein n=1 Tax=Pelagibacterium montanilacus TaxID=2185280 RepID=UPI0013DF8FC1|nr:sugar ABC transporter substrate-binding protein [Pelagibacterium montanilacus]